MESPPTTRPLTDADPRSIGKYVVQGVLGEGATGVVYLAEQVEPFRRRVAVKILKDQGSSTQALARFGLEMEALARLVHPGIARIYENGHLEGGRPYYVMEHIPGVPLTHYCDLRRLDLRERLALFLRVCSAVQYAHQHGIIHRDLKPSNVLVMETGTAPEPRLIDFGLAKVREAGGAGATGGGPLTWGGAILGTLDYMSPEQALGATEVDSRSDVFGLGMMLYELLVGVPPRRRSTSGTLAEALQRAREEEPALPSARVGASGVDWQAVAAWRQSTPRRLEHQLRGDLDCILQKAVRRDPDSRYASVGELADDIRRHLGGEPVSAHPRNPMYLVRKVVLRDRVVAWAVALIVFGVASAASATTSAIHQRVRSSETRTTLIRVAEQIHDLASVSHLRLEEALAATGPWGDDLAQPIEQAVGLSEAVLQGRETPFGTAQASGTTAEGFRRVANALRGLAALSKARLASRDGASGTGTEPYHDYHATYTSVLRDCVAVVAYQGASASPVSTGESWLIAVALSIVSVGTFLSIRRLAREPR